MAFGDGSVLAASSSKVKLFTGFTSTVQSSIAPGNQTGGWTVDATPNLYQTSNLSNSFSYKYSGFTTTVTTSFDNTLTVGRGATWDGTDYYSSASGTEKYAKYSGFTSTVSDSFAPPAPPSDINGISMVQGDFFAVTLEDKARQYDGFSSSVTDSWSVSLSSLTGVTFNGGTGYYIQFVGSWKFTQHNAFTSTINDSFAVASTEGHGTEWDNFTDRDPAAPVIPFIPRAIIVM